MTGTTDASLSPVWRSLADPWPRLFEWVETVTAGRIIECRRQSRWRPAWYVTVEVNGRQRHLYLRCQREESMPWTRTLSLRREYDIMRVLHEHGVAVAEPIAFCEDPEAIMMAAVDGRDRFDAHDRAPTRDAVIADYMRRLAYAHRLDTGAFEAIGLSRPTGPREIGYMGFGLSEKWYREIKPGPDPVIEFIIAWLHRHVPDHRTEVSWIHFDAGQFLHLDNRVTALMDVEFSCLGDPMADLGAMRMRDTAQPIGNLTHAFAVYAAETGAPIDRGVVNFHAVRFALLTAMLSAGTRADPPPQFDLAQWQAWSLMSLMLCLQIIAEEGGHDIEAPAPLSYPAIRHDAAHHAVRRIVDDILDTPDIDDHLAFRLRIVRDLLPGIHRSAKSSEHVEQFDRDEATTALGAIPPTWRAVDQTLEDAARSAPATDRERQILALLTRRVYRQIDLIAPGMRDVQDVRVQPIDRSVLPTT
ncbi:phosphotransferase family enzyme [Arthrobacter sp. SLBN-53]|nr:phosphotransferase [Arthrobacter sp. SLBN-53]TQK27533.1 phosphotransferase family enzyme [Arthrobacter sp. SLBN-53]